MEKPVFDAVPCVGCGTPVTCEVDPSTGRAMWKDDDRCDACWKSLGDSLSSLPNVAYPAGTLWRD